MKKRRLVDQLSLAKWESKKKKKEDWSSNNLELNEGLRKRDWSVDLLERSEKHGKGRLVHQLPRAK